MSVNSSPRLTPKRAAHIQKRNILTNRSFNKGTAFGKEERVSLGLRGLLPPQVETIELQAQRVIQQFRSFERPIDKYIFIQSLKERNETLFYYVLTNNLEEMLPVVYTPTVGDACLNFNQIWRVAEGMYLSENDKGHMRQILDNWDQEVDIIVVTDGSRILGLGDLGANGMGIPIGKLSLYVAAGGFHPSRTLPIQLDTGTNNEQFLNDPLYLGVRNKRIPDDRYYPLVEELMAAIKDKWPSALLQFEDFSNDHCFDLLDKYRNKQLCFNDDIQGTGAVIASGFINACRVSQIPMEEHRIVFFGAGSAGIGVADQIVAVMEKQRNISKEEARKCFYFVDSKGLVTKNRGDNLASFKVPYAREDFVQQHNNLLDVIKAVKPTGLIGLSGMPRSFTEEIVRELAKHSSKPIIFSLSNPTSKAECTAEQAYTWTDGSCIFASGSPFGLVNLNGKSYKPGQGNNMYIFPGLGLGSQLCQSTQVSDNMIVAATVTLANFVKDEDIANGKIYPDLSNIREISAQIAKNVIETAYEEKLATLTPKPENVLAFVKENMYQPIYSNL